MPKMPGLSLLALCLLSAAFLIAAEARAQSSYWNSPADWNLWVGKYSSDTVMGSTLFATPPVTAFLNKYLGKDARSELDNLVVQNPIERHGDWITAFGCMPHDCPDENYTLAIKSDASDVVLCMMENDYDTNRTTLHWFGRNPATKTFPLNAGAQCGSDGTDPTPTLLTSTAVDANGHPLSGGAPHPQQTAAASAPITIPPGGKVWSGWIYTYNPIGLMRTRLTLSGSDGIVSGTWHQETLDNPPRAVDYQVSGVLSREGLKLKVVPLSQKAAGQPGCVSYDNLAFGMTTAGDLKAAVNTSAGIIHTVGPRPFGTGCAEHDIDLFDMSKPAAEASSEAFGQAMLALLNKDTNQELKLLEKSADGGRASAAFEMGMFYLGHPAIEGRIVLAQKAFRQAALMGFVPAKHILACLQPDILNAMGTDWGDRFEAVMQRLAIANGFTRSDLDKFELTPYMAFIEVSNNEFSDAEFSCKPFFKIGVKEKYQPPNDDPAYQTLFEALKTWAEKSAIGWGALPDIYTFDRIGDDDYSMGRQIYPTHQLPAPIAPLVPVAKVSRLFSRLGLN